MTLPHWPIRIITLESDAARRAPLLQRLDELGLTYELSFGIDGRAGLSPELEARIDRVAADRRRLRPLTDAEFACSMSHRKIYETIIARNEPGCIVLEDDAQVGPAFAAFVQSGAYRDFPLLMLDHGPSYVWRSQIPLGPGLVAHRLAQTPNLATGYTLGRTAARALLRVTDPIRDVADWPLPLEDLGAALVMPRLVGHPEKGVLSNLDAARLIVEAQRRPKPRTRYLTAAYWRRFWAKKWALRLRDVPTQTG